MSDNEVLVYFQPAVETIVLDIIRQEVTPRLESLESDVKDIKSTITLMQVTAAEDRSVLNDILAIVSDLAVDKKQWNDYEKRLKHVESDQKLLKRTVKLHSRPIASL